MKITVDPHGYFVPHVVLTNEELYTLIEKLLPVQFDPFDTLLFHYQALRQHELKEVNGLVVKDVFDTEWEGDKPLIPLCIWERGHEKAYLFRENIISFVYEKDGENNQAHYRW